MLCSYYRMLAPLGLLLFGVVSGLAQSALWQDVPEVSIIADPADRLVVPDRYRTLQLDYPLLRNLLITAPTELEYWHGADPLVLDFPMPDGSMETFVVWETPVMHADLTAQYPEIRSYSGKSHTRAGMNVRFSIGPSGLHAMFLNTGSGSYFIDPYARGNTEHYLTYTKKDFVKRVGNTFTCHVGEPVVIEVPQEITNRSAGDCGTRRQYRLALACTGEYANFHGAFGGNKTPALDAMNTTMTRVNGVFERDAGIRMILIANNADIIFTDPAGDPYTNSSGSQMLGENQATCDNIIGTANYDIGHVFSTGGGGIAQLFSPCSNGNKAKGVTGLPSPIGDPFDIDYVSHEMGHQWGAHHTQYNNCQRVNSSAMEPGSASTIMGYAGICAPNVQSNSDDYFHARSLFQMGNFIT